MPVLILSQIPIIYHILLIRPFTGLLPRMDRGISRGNGFKRIGMFQSPLFLSHEGQAVPMPVSRIFALMVQRFPLVRPRGILLITF